MTEIILLKKTPKITDKKRLSTGFTQFNRGLSAKVIK
jgi:hypothetical protein